MSKKNGQPKTAMTTPPDPDALVRKQVGLIVDKMSGHAIFLVDRKGVVKSWNFGAEKAFGYTANEMVGESGNKLLQKGGNGVFLSNLLGDVDFQKSIDFEQWVYRKNKTRFWASLEISAIAGTNGGESIFGFIVRDISERKRVEDSLRDSQQKLRAILEAMPSPVFVKDTELVYTECNQAFAEYNGLAREQIIGSTILDLFEKSKAEIYKKADLDLLKKAGTQVYESKVRFKDGTDHNVVFRKSVYNDGGEKTLGIVGLIEDITNRVRDKENLLQINRIYQLILENSIFGISLIQNRKFKWANNRLGEMLLRPLEKLQGVSTRIMYPSNEFYEQLGHEAYPLLDKGEPYQNTIQLKRSDGTLFWCRFIGKAIAPESPQEGTIWMFEDITDLKKIQDEQKMVEMALKQSQANLLALIENNDDCIWSCDANLIVTAYNSKFKRRLQDLFGLNLKIGAKISKLPGVSFSVWKNRFASVLRGQKFLSVDVFTENSAFVYNEVSLFPIQVEGEVTGIACFSRDITPRKLAEEALLKSQSKLTVAMGLSKMCSWEFDVPTSTIILDEHFYEIYDDTSKGQARQLTVQEFFDRYIFPEDWPKIYEILNASIASNGEGTLNQFEHSMKHKNGEWRHVVARFTNVKDHDGKLIRFLGAIQDVTERKRIEIQLKELNASKDKLFSIIAHDLKNPFHTIIGISELIKAKVSSKDYAPLDYYAKSLYDVSAQTYNLLENLLEWANSQKGGITYNPRKANLLSQITEVVDLLSGMASRKNISITVNIPNIITVFSDLDMLKTILRNLISNAIKFTYTNGNIHLQATISNSMVQLSVLDSGTGMNAETLKNLFKLESTKSILGTSNEKGTGLGLILCKDFVEKQGGVLWAESVEGRGSVFSFTLPIANN
ncbi:MAG TPA: PAS domain S-box protein [Williamwhitmania sp.]|nr:PAS domain S-box protein [Williamwhitmania sp.]